MPGAAPSALPMPYAAIPSAPPYEAMGAAGGAALDARLPSLQLETRQLVFVERFDHAGWDRACFKQYYGARAPLLLGIGGDSTPGVLERLPSEWGPLHPHLVVLLIGTNNTQWMPGTPADVALGIAETIVRSDPCPIGRRAHSWCWASCRVGQPRPSRCARSMPTSTR